MSFRFRRQIPSSKNPWFLLLLLMYLDFVAVISAESECKTEILASVFGTLGLCLLVAVPLIVVFVFKRPRRTRFLGKDRPESHYSNASSTFSTALQSTALYNNSGEIGIRQKNNRRPKFLEKQCQFPEVPSNMSKSTEDGQGRSTVTVQKQSGNGTGIVFGISGIYIRAVDSSLVQVKEGSLAPGDEVTAINGLCLNGMSDLEAYALFSNSSSLVLLEVVKGSCSSKIHIQSSFHPDLKNNIDNPGVAQEDNVANSLSGKTSREKDKILKSKSDTHLVGLKTKIKKSLDLSIKNTETEESSETQLITPSRVEQKNNVVLSHEDTIVSQKQSKTNEHLSTLKSTSPSLVHSFSDLVNRSTQSSSHSNGNVVVTSASNFIDRNLNCIDRNHNLDYRCNGYSPHPETAYSAYINGYAQNLRYAEHSDKKSYDSASSQSSNAFDNVLRHKQSNSLEHYRLSRDSSVDVSCHSRNTSGESGHNRNISNEISPIYHYTDLTVMDPIALQCKRTPSDRKRTSRQHSGDQSHSRKSSNEGSTKGRSTPTKGRQYNRSSSFEDSHSKLISSREPVFTIDAYSCNFPTTSVLVNQSHGSIASTYPQELIRMHSSPIHSPIHSYADKDEGLVLQRGYANDYILPRPSCISYPPPFTVKMKEASQRSRDSSPSRRMCSNMPSSSSINSSNHISGYKPNRSRTSSAENHDLLSPNVTIKDLAPTEPINIPQISSSLNHVSHHSPTEAYSKSPHTPSCDNLSSYNPIPQVNAAVVSVAPKHIPYTTAADEIPIEIDADIMNYMTAKYSEPRFPMSVPMRDPPPYNGSHHTVTTSTQILSTAEVSNLLPDPEHWSPKKGASVNDSDQNFDSQQRTIPENFDSQQRMIPQHRIESRENSDPSKLLTEVYVAPAEDVVVRRRAQRTPRNPAARPHSFTDTGSNVTLNTGQSKTLSPSADSEKRRGKPPQRTLSMPAVKHLEMRPKAALHHLNSQDGKQAPVTKKSRHRKRADIIDNIDRRKSIDSGTLRKLAQEIKTDPSLSSEVPFIAQLLNESQFSAIERRSQSLYRHKSTDALYNMF